MLVTVVGVAELIRIKDFPWLAELPTNWCVEYIVTADWLINNC
jgi:hypothetical protein